MSYSDTLLADGERIVYRGKQHWLAPLVTARYAVGLVILAIVLLFVYLQMANDGVVGGIRWALGWVALAALVVGIAWLVKVYLAWSSEDYVVTDRRVLKVEGVINKHAADSSLDKINDAVVEQHLLGRLLGYGDLDILTAAEESVDRYRMLSHVLTFKRNMLNAKHDIEAGFNRRPTAAPPLRAAPVTAGNGGGVAPQPAAPHMTPDEVTATLARLADLRDRGAITPEEYEAKKAELLDRI